MAGRPLVGLPMLVVLALVGGQLPSFSTAATLYVIGAGVLLVAFARWEPRREPSPMGAWAESAGSLRSLRPGLPAGSGPVAPSRSTPGAPVRRQAPDSAGLGAVWWLLPAGLFAVLEVTTYLRGDTTVSLLADPLLEGEVGRSVGYVGWLAAFWWLVRR